MKFPMLKIALAASALMFAACSDTVVTDYSDSKATATVNFKVSDQISGAALDSVKVTRLAKDSLNVITDSLGYAGFSKVKIGEYLYRFQKTGYATVDLQAAVLDGQSNVPRVPDLNLEIALAKLGATVRGRAFYTDGNGNRLAVDSGTVQLKLGTLGSFTWPNPVLTTQTDANGNYSFANLPEGITYTITVRQVTVGGKAYSTVAPVTVSGVYAGETVTAGAVDLAVSGNALTVNSTNYSGVQQVSTTSPIVIKFSEAVDTSLIRLGNVQVHVALTGNPQVLVTATWSDGNTTLTLTPSDSSTWWDGVTHTITLNLTSTSNASLSGFAGNNKFIPSAISTLPGQATNLRIAYLGSPLTDTTKPNSTTASVRLTWSKATNAQGYAIFKKTPEDSAFVIVDELPLGTDTTVILGTAGDYNLGGAVSFRVVASNTYGYASLANAPSRTGIDLIAPVASGLPATIIPLTLNNLLTTPDTLKNTYATITFNEDMDTTKALGLTPPATASGNVSFYSVWSGLSTIRVIAILAPSADVTTLTTQVVTLDFSKLTDLAGNTVTAPSAANAKLTFH